MNALVGIDHRLEVAGKLFSLEKLLGVVFLDTDPLIFDAVHKGQALGAVDDLGGEFDKLLGVTLEVVKPVAFHEDALDTAAGELSLVLKVGEDVRQLYVVFVEGHMPGGDRLRRIDAGAADGQIRLAPLQARLGDRRCVLECLDACHQQSLIVELHTVGGLVLDALPQGLEVRAFQHGLARLHLNAVVGVFDFQSASQLAEDLLYLR